MTSKPTIMVVDDEEGIRELLKASLSRKGYRVLACTEGREALELLKTSATDLVITDLRMPGMPGEELLAEIKKSWPNLPVVVISAYGNTKNVVEVIKKGAEDYLTKTFTPEELDVVLIKALEKHRLLLENERLRRQLNGGAPGLLELIGRSKPMQEIFALLKRLAPSDATVLLTGESGTGKELAARAIHELSTRAKGPFVEVNAGSLPATLFEAELFGARKGSYTGATENRDGLFQAAAGGTLFLDEVGEVPLESQAKLLRALETHEIKPLGETKSVKIDVRVVAATNQDLQARAAEGRFRQDLFFRLSVLPIRLPSLKDRMEDLPLLAEAFLARFCAKGSQPKRLSAAALKSLLSKSWPGNVRELKNVLERAALLAQDDELQDTDLMFSPAQDQAFPAGNFQQAKHRLLDTFERHYLADLLKDQSGNVSKAALASGLARKNLQLLLKKHDIKPAQYKGKN